jgi:hypothetical protein
MLDDIGTSETYYARVSDREAAEEAVRRYLDAPSHITEARLPVQSSLFDAKAASRWSQQCNLRLETTYR